MSLPPGTSMSGLTLEMLDDALAHLPESSPWKRAPKATILPSSFCEKGQAYAIHNRDRLADEAEHVIVLHPELRDRILYETRQVITPDELGQLLWWFAMRQSGNGDGSHRS